MGRYAPSDGQNGDMGWVSPLIHRKLEIVKYYNKLMGMEDERLNVININVKMLDYLNSGCPIIIFKPCSEYIINTLMEKYANQ